MTAIAYIRVSTEKQDKSGLGLEDQQTKIEQYCRLRDIGDVEIIVDGDDGDDNEAIKRRRNVSASKVRFEDRPQGRRIMERIRAGEVSDLIVLNIARIFRNTEDGLAAKKEFDGAGVALHIIDLGGNTINTGSAYGRFIYTLLIASTSLEAELSQERTTAALAVKARNGGRVSRNATFGYRLVDGPPDDKGHPTKVQVEDAQEQKAIARIMELKERRYSLRQIARQLESEGFKSRLDKRISQEVIRKVIHRNAVAASKEDVRIAS